MELAQQSADITRHMTDLLVGSTIGGFIGVAVALTALFVTRREISAPATRRLFNRRIALPLVVMFVVLGVWVGYTLTELDPAPSWYSDVNQGLLLLLIASGAWLSYAALGLLGEPVILTNVKTGRDARRFRTQAQILRRAAQAAVVILAIVLGLLTFPEARAPMLSVLASAGLLSVVVGLAAQTSLGNMFAGLQLALTDAIRVGDTVILPGETQPGSIEEITLTYVVVRIWDNRRIILPSTEFTTKPFENWTRTEVEQLAVTSLELDWSAPVAEIRAEIGRLVEASPLWDGKTWSVQVFTVTSSYLELRVVVSAANWAAAWDLRSYVRENIVAWIMANAPWSVPQEVITISPWEPGPGKILTEEVDPAALSGPLYVGPAGGGDAAKWQVTRADPEEVLRKEDEARRKREESTMGKRKRPPKLLGKFLFSGSEEARERGRIYDGPGPDVLRQRAARKAQRQEEAESPDNNDE